VDLPDARYTLSALKANILNIRVTRNNSAPNMIIRRNGSEVSRKRTFTTKSPSRMIKAVRANWNARVRYFWVRGILAISVTLESTNHDIRMKIKNTLASRVFTSISGMKYLLVIIMDNGNVMHARMSSIRSMKPFARPLLFSL